MTDAEHNAVRLAHESIAAGDPTGWFERLYSAAAAGQADVPWDRRAPSPLLVQWATERGFSAALDRSAQAALVVGCGLGDDAEFISSLGFRTVACDISVSAIQARDMPLLQGSVLFATALVILGNLVADILYSILDPRVRSHLGGATK